MSAAFRLYEKVAEGYRIPGFVDAHVHVESSHLVPEEFGKLLLSHGTVAAVCDPHEVVNVMGAKGLDFMLSSAARSPAKLYFTLPSCVPATPFETAGAALSAVDTERLLDAHPELVGLAEMMNVPGVLGGDAEVLAKIAAARSRGKVVDGHFPGGSGADLKRYAAAGICSDHESTTAEEALEKVACGMTVFIREGSSAKNLEALLPAVNGQNHGNFCFCADDLSAADLRQRGDILNCVRMAVRLGLDPEWALEMASVNPRRHFGLPDAPGDYLIVKDLEDFEIVAVYRDGVRCEPAADESEAEVPVEFTGTVHLPDLANLSFPLPTVDVRKVRAIGVEREQLLTRNLLLGVAEREHLARLAVIERHGKNGGGIGYAYAAGTGLSRGAIACTVAHDSHNLIVLGASDADMRFAARRLGEIGGGAVVVEGGRVLAEMPLPVAGLMSSSPASVVAAQDRALREAAAITGCTLPEPLTTLSFLALPVIPELRVTDKGLFDAVRFEFAGIYE